jgi:tetratricopeptide (TPR) repeat protein
MSGLDEVEDLLKKGEEEKAFGLVKDKDSKVKNSLAEELIERGSFLADSEEYDLAITYFDFAYEIAIDSEIKKHAGKHLTVAYNNRGKAYSGKGEFDIAIEDYRKAIKLDPNYALAYTNRGYAYYRLEKDDEAIEDCNKAIELDSRLARAYSTRGGAYYGLKRYKKAIEDCNKAIELDSRLARAYYNRGNAYTGLKKYKKAIEDCNKAIELDPKFADAFYNRGNAYSRLKRYKEAIEDYNETIKIGPKFADAFYNRGNAYSRLKRYKEAIEDYNETIELDQKFADAYTNRGDVYSRLKRYEEAISDCTKAIELDQNSAKAYSNRGVVYYKIESYRKAKRDYNKAIALDPKFGIAHANLGDLLYTIEEDYDNAEREYRKALEINKNIGYAHNGLGLVLTKRKAYKNAIAEFKKAIKPNKKAIKPNEDVNFYNNIGCAYAEYGKGSAIALCRFLKARTNLRKATLEKGKREKWKDIIFYVHQEKNAYVEAHKNLTHAGESLYNELKISLFRISVILFVSAWSLFALSINLVELSKSNLLEIILIVTGVVTLGIVLFSLDFTKIWIKSLKIAGVVEAEFEYEKSKARKEALEFANPNQFFEHIKFEEATIYTSTEAEEA